MAITWQLPVLFDTSFAFQMHKRGILQGVFSDLEPCLSWRHGLKDLVHCSSTSWGLRRYPRYEIVHVVMNSRQHTSLNVVLSLHSCSLLSYNDGRLKLILLISTIKLQHYTFAIELRQLI